MARRRSRVRMAARNRTEREPRQAILRIGTAMVVRLRRQVLRRIRYQRRWCRIILRRKRNAIWIYLIEKAPTMISIIVGVFVLGGGNLTQILPVGADLPGPT